MYVLFYPGRVNNSAIKYDNNNVKLFIHVSL
jgi:hypothetical protein